MTTRINKLTLTSFRGATRKLEISFDSTKPVALIFGENGTGKSTIGDSLDFICNARFGSLDDRTMPAQPKSHVASLGQDATKLRIALVTTVGDFTATLSKNGPVILPAVGCPDARILRRSNILDLLDEQPKKRFEALKAFISVTGIERSENALREAQRNTQVDYDEAVRSSTQASEELEKLWKAEGQPGNGAHDWAKSEVAKDLTAMRNEVNKLGGLLASYQDVEGQLTALDLATTELNAAQEAHSKAIGEQRDVEKKQATSDVPLLRLLQEARDYLTSRKALGNCPVCEQTIVGESLVRALGSRISEMSELAAATAVVVSATRIVDAKESVVNQASKDFCRKTKSLAVALRTSSPKEVADLGIVWTNFEELCSHMEPTLGVSLRAREFWSLVVPTSHSLLTRKNANQKSIDQKSAIQVHHDTYRDKWNSAQTLGRLAAQLKQALDIVTQHRKAYVEGILATVSTEVERLYTKLHPGEGIGKIRFYLKPSAIGSLEFDGQFQGVNEIPPQAYYSESHLDTLGICVFLSLAKYFKTENTIIVLDDVVTSVDGPHLDRFMDLLHEEASNFNQVIVTTHYRPWKDRYRYARGPAAKTQVIELRSWSLSAGIQTDEAMTLLQELTVALAGGKFDRQDVAAKAGIQLENLLDFLTFQYRCRLPRQSDPNYTLGDLAGGIDTKLGKVLRMIKALAGGAKGEVLLKPMIDELTAQTWVRNRAGCHFHSLGSEIPDSDVREFASKVVALTEVIVCPTCQRFPTRRPTGSFWQCDCGAIEMHPLISPSAALGTVAPDQ